MKNYNIIKSTLVALGIAIVPHILAQDTLIDYETGTVDLGLGVKQSQLLTTASTYIVSGEELKKTAALTLKDALYGKLLGLTALKKGGSSSDYGYGATMNVRGIQSTSENGVLILVDGIERSIDYMTLDEVESVTVLKDAAAVALYGYEGVNGALLIKTKRGTANQNRVTVSYDHKFTFDPKVTEFVDAYTYARAVNQARGYDGLSAMYNDYELNAFALGLDPYYYPNVNWKDEVFKGKGSEDKANISLNGGNDKVQYFAMLDYTDSRGLLKGTDQEKYSSQLKLSKANIRANLDVQLTNSTSMQVNASGIFVETNRPAGATANDLAWMLYNTPASAFPILNDPTSELAAIWGGNTAYGVNNPVAKIQASGFQKSHSREFQGDVTLKQKFDFWVEGLELSARFGYTNFVEIYEQNSLGYMYGYQRYAFDSNGIPMSVTNYTAGDKTNNLSYSYWNNQHVRSSYLSLSANYQTTFTGNDNFIASMIWHQKHRSSDGRYQTINRMNYIAYLHYDVNQKFTTDLVLTLNGSNRSYPHKWSFAPTLSVGYIFKNNAEAAGINMAKLRASGGMQHTDYVPINGIWLENYNGGGGDYFFGAGTGSQQWGTFIGYMPTSNFKLETAYKANVGIDMRLFRSLDLNVDGYYQLRDNILLSGDGLNSMVVGIPSSYINWGKVASYGVEAGVNWVKNVASNSSINIGANVTWGRNKILRTIENVAYDYLSAVGGRVNQAWGLQTNGFFGSIADVNSSLPQEFDICKPGDIKYVDYNKDGSINENDRIKMGYDTAFPELNFSLNLGFRIKGFGINAQLQGAAHYTQYCGVTGVYTPLIDGANLSKHYYENSWGVSENPTYPRLTTKANNNNYRENDLWYKDINFLKLRSCEAYYFFPESVISKIKLSQLKLFVKGENLFTLSNMKEMDPENIGTVYPTLKGVALGLSFMF